MLSRAVVRTLLPEPPSARPTLVVAMGGGRPVEVETVDTQAARGKRDAKIRWALLAILAGAFALRLIVFLLALRDPNRFYSPDGREYWALGQHFGTAFGDTRSAFFDLGLKRTPGYPGMLAAITSVSGDRESVVIFLQVLMGVATVALLYLLARDLCGVRAALIAAALLAVDPISVIMPSYLQPETPFTLMLV